MRNVCILLCLGFLLSLCGADLICSKQSSRRIKNLLISFSVQRCSKYSIISSKPYNQVSAGGRACH